MTTKPNTFPKAYVKARIEARKASLESQIKAANLVLEAWWKSRVLEMDAVIEARAIQMAGLNQNWTKVQALYAKANTPKQKYQALTGQKGYFYFTSIPNQSNDDAADRASVTVERCERELALLTHTLAYFEEAPVEEYTITGLKQLGLLEAVKFSMPVPDK
jgi:hypothetical protein